MAALKRGNPERNTPPKDIRHKRNKESLSDDPASSYCLVAMLNVLTSLLIAIKKKGLDGDDALFCESECQAWVHA